MTAPDDPKDEALKRLDDRLDALAASQSRKRLSFETGGAGAAYRLVAELVGSVLTGLGAGYGLDRFLGVAPFGLIAGLLIGAVVGVILVVRSSSRAAGPGPSSGRGRSRDLR